MLSNIRNFHSEGAKRKAEESMELLHSSKVPHIDSQLGSAVTTRGTKREAAEGDTKSDVKVPKPDAVDPVTEPTNEYAGGPDLLFVDDFKKLRPAKRLKKNTLVNQKFIITLDQKFGPREGEDLNIGATYALAVAMDNLINDLQIPDDSLMTLQIGSRERRKEGLTGETWKVPVGDFTERALYTQAMLENLSNVLNNGQFITNDVGFSASILFTRPVMEGSKRAGGGPGQKIWQHIAKQSRCECEIKNKDELCCARAIVVMRENSKRQAGEQNTFENINKDRGKIPSKSKKPRNLMLKRASLKDLVAWTTL